MKIRRGFFVFGRLGGWLGILDDAGLATSLAEARFVTPFPSARREAHANEDGIRTA